MTTVAMAEIEVERFGDTPFSQSGATSMAAYILQEQYKYRQPARLNNAMYETAKRRQRLFTEQNPDIDVDQSELALLVNTSRIAYEYLNMQWRKDLYEEERKIDPDTTIDDINPEPVRMRLPGLFASLPDDVSVFLQGYYNWPDFGPEG